jgi:hypothetical protein
MTTEADRFSELAYYLEEAKNLYEAGNQEGALVYLENAHEELTKLMGKVEELT